MKLENNWRQKSLENLEKKNIGVPEKDNSRLVNRVLHLRKIPLDEYTTEDVRLMIGQNEGLEYLIRLAIDILKDDLFAEGDFYPGDLLRNVLSRESQFWAENKELWIEVDNLIHNKIDRINENDIHIPIEPFYNSVQL
jgi:hypothetical protein